MRIIAKRALRLFWSRHRDAEGPLTAWYNDVAAERWLGPADIRRRYRHADFVANNRVIFNVGGNKYRLVTYVRYDRGIVYIRFVGTHAEYDRIDPGIV